MKFFLTSVVKKRIQLGGTCTFCPLQINMPLAIMLKGKNNSEEQQQYTCFKCHNFIAADKAAFKRHLTMDKTTYYCSYCPVFKNLCKQKVIAHELKYHRELVEPIR